MARWSLVGGVLISIALGGPALALAAADAPLPGKGFSLKEKPGECLDVLLDGRVAARYMCAYDKSTPKRLHDTNKPYLHVFDAEGKQPITNGPSGLYPHHRGIFIGWTRLGFEGRSYDFWGMGSGEIVHQKLLDQKAGPDRATFTSLTHWNDKAGRTLVVEERTMAFRRGPAGVRLAIDFTSKLRAPACDVMLDGDPEHAGVHYRPANQLDVKKTLYVFPREKANAKVDLDYPWVGETYTLGNKQYSVVQMNHPDNPRGTKFSAYRDYGRFGAFFTKTLRSGDSLMVKYRFLVADGEMPRAAVIQKCWDEHAGASSPSAVPRTSVVPAD